MSLSQSEQIEYKVYWRTYGALESSSRCLTLVAAEHRMKQLQGISAVAEVWLKKTTIKVERLDHWYRRSKVEV